MAGPAIGHRGKDFEELLLDSGLNRRIEFFEVFSTVPDCGASHRGISFGSDIHGTGNKQLWFGHGAGNWTLNRDLSSGFEDGNEIVEPRRR